MLGIWKLGIRNWDCFLGLGIWTLGFGLWVLEFGLWPLGFGIWLFGNLAFAFWNFEMLPLTMQLNGVSRGRTVFCFALTTVR